MASAKHSLLPSSVIEAFNAEGEVVAAAGGMGTSYYVGNAVFKHVAAQDELQAAWCASVFDGLKVDGVRIPRPLLSSQGYYIVNGWSASEYVPGETGPHGRWEQILATSRALHKALSGISCPEFIRHRVSPWATGDRVAWDEATIEPLEELRQPFERLISFKQCIDYQPFQIIHADLAGNILFSDGLDPAVIDFSPNWRPAAYGDAIVVVDGILWYGGGETLIDLGSSGADFLQLLVRALLFRLVAYNELVRAQRLPFSQLEVGRFNSAMDLVEQRLTGRQV
ncbi:uncharacterized protein V1513DRAFT_234139 [Lipomyces chichibuensis]|uniref:uncharacterized protein n=1 Tax=Lipomyces chichibuensis TaxID=1546026 RepID=UPI0033438937